MTVMVGSDCEVVVVDSDGNPVSAIGMIGGSKEHPRITPNGSVQEDNVLAEFNVIPASEPEEFVNNFNAVTNDLREILPDGYDISFVASARFDVVHLSHPLAVEVGCSPDYDAWDLKRNTPPNLNGNSLRSAGGHIHISWKHGGDKDKVLMARAMDMYLGIPSLILDKDKDRRELYGKAGSHRPKDYGVEWRTGSNFWAVNNDRIAWAFNNSIKALDNRHKFEQGMEWVKDIINNHDINKAKEIINKYNIAMP